MKNPVLSLWLLAAYQAANFWMGHATTAGRWMQREALAEMARAAAGTAPEPMRRVP